MQHDQEYLVDILEAAKIIQNYVGDRSKDDFLNDPQCQDAVIRRFEIIGEAARRVSETTQQSIPELPWTDITGLRNRLIHQYDDVDMKIVWDTICKDIPSLISTLKSKIEADS